MREMGDADPGAGNAGAQFDTRKNNHPPFGFQRNGREQRDFSCQLRAWRVILRRKTQISPSFFMIASSFSSSAGVADGSGAVAAAPMPIPRSTMARLMNGTKGMPTL